MDPLDELKQLVYVAHEHSRDSQLELLWRITGVLLHDPGSYSDHQRLCFGEIMEKLAYDLEQEIRAELSHMIATEALAPHRLVRRLAGDEISVARPVLERSPVLTQADLVEIASSNGNQHCLAVTKRTDIGGRLSSVLVEYGDLEMVDRLTRNTTATISGETADRIAGQARSSPSLQTALIGRDDIPKEIMVRLLDEVSEKMRFAVEGGLEDQDAEALEAAVDAVRAKVEESPDSRVEAYIGNLLRQGMLNEQAVLRFLYEDRPMEFLIGLARLCEMDAVAMEHVLADETGRTLIIVCRAKDFGIETFKAIAVSRMCAISSDPADLYPLTRIYKHFAKEKAQRAMRFLRTRAYSARKDVARAANVRIH